MREVHGAVHAPMFEANPGLFHASLKQHALMFNQLHVVSLDDFLRDRIIGGSPEERDSLISSMAFLRERGFLVDFFWGDVHNLVPGSITEYFREYCRTAPIPVDELAMHNDYCNFLVRSVSCILGEGDSNVVPLLTGQSPLSLNHTLETSGLDMQNSDVLRIAIEVFPVPGDQSSWQDILDFKGEARDKLWHFRRFLHTLATKKQTEAEIRDDIEWTLNEYRKAMEIYELKSSQSSIEVFVVSPLEIIENLVKFNWSKIAKGTLQVWKRKVELMEAEMKAPGRECAYLFDVRKRFGGC
jgi:hypothetical protein